MVEAKLELKRHIDKWLLDWKNNPLRKPALIKGIRQSGKTHSILSFIHNKQIYDAVIYLNFWDNPELIDVFDGRLDIDSIITELSVKLALPNLIPNRTVFFFDEIQECPRALLSLKSNVAERKYDFIASGSYLGINGYVVDDATPLPVGCVDEFDMRTLDFKEFLWAKGYKDEQIKLLEDAFYQKKPLPNSMHSSFSALYREYLCVGGFPEAVKNFVLSNNIYSSLQITRRIVRDLQSDFGRRRSKNKMPIFNQNEVARIRSAFSLIPSFLAKENKRYIVSKIEGKGSKGKGSNTLEYLKDAGILLKVHNLSIPSTPLSINAIQNQYKVFPSDIGILLAMLEDGTTDAILSNNLGMGKGMIYESLVAEALYKRGGNLYYFAKDTGLELDFVLNLNGQSTILEAKAKDGNSKSAKTVMKHPEHYGKTNLIVIKDSNITLNNGILTIPHYMTYLLLDYSPTISSL